MCFLLEFIMTHYRSIYTCKVLSFFRLIYGFYILDDISSF